MPPREAMLAPRLHDHLADAARSRRETQLGALLAVGAWGPLANLFSGYQDSPAWVYRLYGGPLLVLSVMCFVGSWRSLRRG